MSAMVLDVASSIGGPLRWKDSPADLVLPPEEIHVFAFALDLPAPRLAQLEPLLSQDEADRADRFRQAQDRRRYVVGRAQLRTILGRYLDREPYELEFRYGSHGKPALHGECGREGIRFNLSRSHELGVLAMQLDHDLGIDVERVRPFPDALDIAKRFFAPEEYAALCSLLPAGLDVAFFSYWTRKEAVVKSIGLGLSLPMDGFVLTPHPGADAERVVVAGADGTITRWSLSLPPPLQRYVGALATAGAPCLLQCWTWADPPAPHR